MMKKIIQSSTMLSLLCCSLPSHAGVTNFLDSSSAIVSFQFISFFIVFAFASLMLLNKAKVARGKTLSIGVLLIVLGLLQVAVWDVNYMVIGMGLIALSGALLAFDNAIGKVIYIIGSLIIVSMASVKYGMNTKGFFMQSGLLFIIGFVVLTLETSAKSIAYEYEAKTPEALEKDRKFAERLQHKAQNSQAMDVDTNCNMIRYGVLGLFLLMAVLMLVSALF